MYKETCSENRNHDGDDRKRHEIATSLEKSVSRAISSLNCVDHREEIDGHVKKHEDDQEETADTHDELLGN